MSKKPNIFLLLLIYLPPLCLILFLLANMFLPSKDNVYSKIAKGQTISILVAGDSIGKGFGASKPELNFIGHLKEYLLHNYSVTATVVNTSMGGNTSYSEYVRVSQLSNAEKYDLVIICCGENDLSYKSLGKTYEALIRAVKIKWPNAEIISVLQSSQKTYTQKIQTIQSLSKHYNIPIADTIEPFTNGKNGEYRSLTRDGIHPNDKGYNIYACVIEKLIETKAQTKSKNFDIYSLICKNHNIPEPLLPDSEEYANFQIFTTNNFKIQGNEFNCSINIPQNSHLGIDVNLIEGSNCYEFIINGNSVLKKEFVRKHFTQRHIIELTDNFKLISSGDVNICVKFKYNNQADSFKGLFLSSPVSPSE